jgi:hypothetical protein
VTLLLILVAWSAVLALVWTMCVVARAGDRQPRETRTRELPPRVPASVVRQLRDAA